MAKMQKHICRCCSYVKYSKAINRALAQPGKGHA
jgi:aerobic-type carbon monoxide dehydrogenase small subunit (CoxS/CutS family)